MVLLDGHRRLGVAWEIVPREGPDVEVRCADETFGLEVTEVFVDPKGEHGSERKRGEAERRKVVTRWADRYYGLGGPPIEALFLLMPPLSDHHIRRMIAEAPREPGRVVRFEDDDLTVHVSPAPPGYRRWQFVPDKCGYVRGATAADKAEIATWMQEATNNGEQEVLVLYGYFPETIYPAANAQPDGSLAELFIESTDGDTIINHGDYMFYISSTNNGTAGLQNMMDNTAVTMSADNTPMKVTAEGKAIASSLTDFWSDRVFFPDQLTGEWYVEAALARNADGTRVELAIVRDGGRGRLIAAFHTMLIDVNFPPDPKGAVAAEIIAWLMTQIPEVEPVTDVYVLMGNVNTDAKVDIADAIALLGYLFGGGTKPPPVCAKAADANDDNKLDIADAIKILGYLFSQQPMLAPDHSTITAATNTCKGYAADGVDTTDGKPYFPVQVSGLPPCDKQCTP